MAGDTLVYAKKDLPLPAVGTDQLLVETYAAAPTSLTPVEEEAPRRLLVQRTWLTRSLMIVFARPNGRVDDSVATAASSPCKAADIP